MRSLAVYHESATVPRFRVSPPGIESLRRPGRGPGSLGRRGRFGDLRTAMNVLPVRAPGGMPIGPVLLEWSISCRVAGSWRPSSCAASPVVLSLSASTRQLGKLQMTQKTSLSFALQQGSSRRGRIVRHRLNGEQLEREKYKMSALTLDTRRAKYFNLM